jgi:hypothetical protein
MKIQLNRARLALLAGALGALALAGCDRVKNQLLAPQNPGLVDPGAVGNATASLALRVGAIGRFKQVVSAGEGTWQSAGDIADEFQNADFDATRINLDQRREDPNVDMWGYGPVTQSRGFIRDAITSMLQYNPDSTALIGELYAELGFFEMTLADNYCNGIPLGHTLNNVVTYGEPVTGAQVYDSASAHLDTALAYSSKGTDAGSVYINRMARIWKARVLTNLGQYANAASLVSTAAVPTTYAYDMTFSATGGGSNGMYSLIVSGGRIGVADSFAIVGGKVAVIQNALPFGSSGDPRVQVVLGSTVGSKPEDQVTQPFYVSKLWLNQYDPLVLASGVDARLTEAEAKLNANDIAGMMTILNDLRTNTTRPVIGLVTIPVMAALPTPATKDAAITLLFRERGFWTFARGQRLADLRRLVRQYGRTDAQVFPTGLYFKGGSYGTDENLPVPNSEQVNPLFHGCLDRKA